MRPLKNTCEVAVVGGGIAGLSAARHAARLGCLVTLLEVSGLYGGLVATIDDVEGLPVPGKFSGQALAMHLLEGGRKAGIHVLEAGVTRIELGSRLMLADQDGRAHHPEAIIVASGASLRKLRVPREEEFLGRGLSRCATCDGGCFRGKDVVVTGGGDAAIQEALILAKTSRRVIMVCRSPLKAKREAIEKLAAADNVSFIWDSEVCDILGVDGVAGVRVRNVKTGEHSEVECSGLFPFIGIAPNTGFMPAPLLTPTGHVQTSAGLATSDPRVLAAGAARAGYGGNIVQALAEGVGAAESAARLVSHS